MSKTVQFTDTSTNANTYYWQFGDGNTSGDRNPIHTYGEYGDYVVVLTITDNNGNSDEFQQNVSLSLPNVDEPPKAELEVPPVTDSPKRFPSAKVGALDVGTFKGFNVAKLFVQLSKL